MSGSRTNNRKKVQPRQGRYKSAKTRGRVGPVYMVVTAIFLILAISWCVQLVQADQSIDAEIQELTQEKADLVARNEALRKETELLHTPAYIEKLAREKLGLVRKGEIVIAPKADGT